MSISGELFECTHILLIINESSYHAIRRGNNHVEVYADNDFEMSAKRLIYGYRIVRCDCDRLDFITPSINLLFFFFRLCRFILFHGFHIVWVYGAILLGPHFLYFNGALFLLFVTSSLIYPLQYTVCSANGCVRDGRVCVNFIRKNEQNQKHDPHKMIPF